MEKTNSSKAIEGVNARKPKTITAATLGVPSSHGMKLSLNMTSQDKKELMCKLEEWRKARREKLASSILAKQKQMDRPKGFPVLPLKGRPSGSGTYSFDTSAKKSQDKETVFERLYKNSKKKQEAEVKVPQPMCRTIKNKTLGVSVAEKKFNVHRKLIENSISSNKSSTGSSVPGAFEIMEFSLQDHLKNVSNKGTVEQQKENLEEDGKSEVSKKRAVQDHAEPLFPELDPSNVEVSEPEVKVITEKKVNNQLLKSQIVNSVVKTESEGYCAEIRENGGTKTDAALEEHFEVVDKEKNENLYPKLLKMNGLLSEKTEMGKCLSDAEQLKKVLPSKVPVKVRVEQKSKITLRRSISMLYHKKCRPDLAIHRTHSEKNLHELRLENQKTPFERVRILSPAIENEQEMKYETRLKSTPFVTPKNNKLLTSTNLRNKLENWLKMNGHSLEGYRHLRCFGIVPHEKPAAMPLAIAADTLDSETPPQGTPVDDSDKENSTPPTAIQQVDVTDAGNWLKELHRLIVELKYPNERCEEWLAAIRRKCAMCAQMPVYWECMAALDESKGDIKSAIEHYERAIIKGKDVDSVGDSLAQLFDKMVIDQKKPSKFKLEKGLDPKNIFKSTIIKFALQQKALKESGSNTQTPLFVATPVRRSSRIRTPYKPHIVSSLQCLTPEIKKNLTFKTNESLLHEG